MKILQRFKYNIARNHLLLLFACCYRYFLHRPGFDGKPVNAQQSLDDGVQLAQDGWVDLGSLRYKLQDGAWTIASRVRSSHFSAVSYVVSVSGECHSFSRATPRGVLRLVGGACNCCVGRGETDKHLSALCWALCDLTQRKRLDTCTSVRNMWLQSQAAGVASRGSHNKKNYNLQSAAAVLLDDKGGYKYDPARCKQVSLERLRLHLLESGVEAACFSNYSEPQPGAPAQPPAKSQRLSSTNASRSTSTSLPENEPLKPQPSPVQKKRQDTPPAPPLRRPSSPLKSAVGALQVAYLRARFQPRITTTYWLGAC